MTQNTETTIETNEEDIFLTQRGWSAGSHAEWDKQLFPHLDGIAKRLKYRVFVNLGGI